MIQIQRHARPSGATLRCSRGLCRPGEGGDISYVQAGAVARRVNLF
jgi:hypothetical protein